MQRGSGNLALTTSNGTGMKVFISWSGERSNAVALALRDWLHDQLGRNVHWDQMARSLIAATGRNSDGGPRNPVQRAKLLKLEETLGLPLLDRLGKHAQAQGRIQNHLADRFSSLSLE